MSNEKHQCGLCKHVTVKSKLFGGKKYLCSIQHKEVARGVYAQNMPWIPIR